MPNLGLILRFVLAAAIGAGGAFGVGAAVGPSALVSTARQGPTTAPTATFAPTGPSGAPLEFAVHRTGGNPIALEALPAESTIQLASAESKTPAGLPTQPWWNPSIPRIAAISQFDGGPLQSFNCTMASGAMLARLAFGIVTTGSQLRGLSGVPRGGSNFNDLGRAIDRGWSVRFFKGALSPLQLRALLYGGAGAAIAGEYSRIPVNLRLQKSFVGRHAIYIDGFRPAGPAGPAAYYVIDPIGRPWAGYRGDWWPAEIVEDFAIALRGFIDTTWAFPGGQAPATHPILPLDAYPTATGSPRPTQSPGATGSPGPTESASESASPIITDPMPPTDVPGGGDTTVGEPPPPETPKFPRVELKIGEFEIAPVFPCSLEPRKALCPSGILGIIDLLGTLTATPTPAPTIPPLPPIKFLYADVIAPGTYQIVFESPPDTSVDLTLWPAGTSGGSVEVVSAEDALLDGKAVSVATFTLDPNASYSFVATASGDGTRTTSDIGSLVVTP